MCSGPILIIIGIATLASTSSDTRSQGVSAFNSAASAWNSGGAQLFADGRTFALRTTAAGTTSLILLRQSTADSYPDRDGINLPNVSVSYGGVSLPNSPIPASTQPSQSFSLDGTAPAAVSSLTNVPVYATTTTSISCSSGDSQSTCQSRCPSNSQYNPTLSRTTCTRFWRISEVCLVVVPATNMLDMSGGAGCAVPSDYSPSAALSSNGLAAISYSASGSQPSDVSSNIRVTVRSSQDPYVVMMRLTKGTGNFGLSVAQKGTLGGALLGIGVAITICVGLTVYYLLKNCIKSNSSPGAVISAVPPQGQMPYGAPQQAAVQVFAKEQPQQYFVQQPQLAVPMQAQQMYVQPFGQAYPQQQAVYAQQPQAQQVFAQPIGAQLYPQQQPVGYMSQQPVGYAMPMQQPQQIYMQQPQQPQQFYTQR